MPTTSAEHDIRQAGLRCTAQRIAVLTTLREHAGHLRVDDVQALVRSRLGSVSTQAVYDSLGALAGAGLARRIEPGAGPARFEARSGDNHHHVVCRHCGETRDVDCIVGAAPCLEPSPTSGFTIDEAEITFWGTCHDCDHARRSGDVSTNHPT